MENSHGNILTKIPLQISHKTDTKDDFLKSSMQIFHLNKIKLIQLQDQLSSPQSSPKLKEMMVKVYNIFQDMNYIFLRLGRSDLFQQIKTILNTVSKIALIYEANGVASTQIKTILKQKTKYSEQFQKQYCVCTKKPQLTKRKAKKFGGVFLYNQSYIKYVQKQQSKYQSKQPLINIQFLQSLDSHYQVQRQQMNLFIAQSKGSSLIKIKDHSKKYEEIQDQFRIIQQKLKQMADNLKIQLLCKDLNQFQYSSRQQINITLNKFNENMRLQLLDLKNVFQTAYDKLMQQKQKLEQILKQQKNRKNQSKHVQVQTIQTVTSIKKIKKISQDYQKKIKFLQSKIQVCQKKEKENINTYELVNMEKQKQIKVIYEKLYEKQQIIIDLNNKCQSYQEKNKQLQQLRLKKYVKSKHQQPDSANQTKLQQFLSTLNQNIFKKKRSRQSQLHQIIKSKNLSRYSHNTLTQLYKIDQPSQLKNNEAQQQNQIYNQIDSQSQVNNNFLSIPKNIQRRQSKNNFLKNIKNSRNSTFHLKRVSKNLVDNLQNQDEGHLQHKPYSGYSKLREKRLQNRMSKSSNNSFKQKQILHRQLKNRQGSSHQMKQQQHKKVKSHPKIFDQLTNLFPVPNKDLPKRQSKIIYKNNQKQQIKILPKSQSKFKDLEESNMRKEKTVNQIKIRYKQETQKPLKKSSLNPTHNIKQMKNEKIKVQNKKQRIGSSLQNKIYNQNQNLTQPQNLMIAKILEQPHMDFQKLQKKITKNHPRIHKILQNLNIKTKIFQQIKRIHRSKCKQVSTQNSQNCTHLQKFVQFCHRFHNKQKYTSEKRRVIKMHIENIQSV